MGLTVLLSAAEVASQTTTTGGGLVLEGVSGALILMVIGMVTVFIVLLLVIGLGHVLIDLVNKYAPEEEKPAPKTALASANALAADPNVVEAINKAVQTITNGKGKVESIRKI